MNRSGIISGVSISHANASLDDLEAATLESEAAAVERLLDAGAAEAFVLQTCNRVEAYVVTDQAAVGRGLVGTLFEDVPESVMTRFGHEESLHHLLRVAAGLESLVIGEDQILGQVRDAYETAREADAIGPILEDGITKAIRVGERARTETAINEGVVSIASAAVQLAAETHGLDGATAVVVGTGEMGTLAAKHLADQVAHLALLNRTRDHAESLQDTLAESPCSIETDSLEALAAHLDPADIVITATGSSEHIVTAEAFDAVSETFVVDITRPRDVPPAVGDRPHVTFYDLDTLEGVTEKTRERRQDAATVVESIVDEEFERLLAQYKRKRADQIISAMYESAERVKASELERSLNQLDLDEDEAAVVEAMADSIVSQLLAPPTNSLRDAAQNDDWTTIHTAIQLFDPNFDPGSDASPAFVSEMPLEAIPEEVREQVFDAEDSAD